MKMGHICPAPLLNHYLKAGQAFSFHSSIYSEKFLRYFIGGIFFAAYHLCGPKKSKTDYRLL